jgi:hypothetical protein
VKRIERAEEDREPWDAARIRTAGWALAAVLALAVLAWALVRGLEIWAAGRAVIDWECMAWSAAGGLVVGLAGVARAWWTGRRRGR